MQLTKDILPVLATMTAQGPLGPRAVRTDATARLLTATSLNPTDAIQAVSAVGGTNVFVTTISLFPPGTYIYLIPVSGGATRISGPHEVQQQVGSNQLQVSPALLDTYGPGDQVMVLSPVVSEGFFPDGRPVDVSGHQDAAPGNISSVSLAGNVKQRVRLAFADADLVQTGANATITDLQVWDGPALTGTLLYKRKLSVPATANAIDSRTVERVRLASSKGNALTIRMDPGVASVQASVSAGGWLD